MHKVMKLRFAFCLGSSIQKQMNPDLVPCSAHGVFHPYVFFLSPLLLCLLPPVYFYCSCFWSLPPSDTCAVNSTWKITSKQLLNTPGDMETNAFSVGKLVLPSL